MHQKLIDIIAKYIKGDVNNLVLKKNNKELSDLSKNDFDILVNQVACRQKHINKFPIILQNNQFIFPNALSAEQASSELAAYYKSNIIKEYSTSVDLTGGLGIDTIYFSKKSSKHIYCESSFEIYNAFSHNCKVLKLKNIRHFNSTAEEFIDHPAQKYDVLYIDPSRRDNNNSKVFLLEDLSPNFLSLQKYFFKIADKAIIKLSPMFDINEAIELIENVVEVHIVSINNDCKELLLVCNYKNPQNTIFFTGVNFICHNNFIYVPKNNNITNNDITSVIKQTQRLEYNLSDTNKIHYSPFIEKFIFEPNPSIMKLACWNELYTQFNISKLHPNSNLFTANITKKKFPGYIYEVVDVVNYDRKKIVNIIGEESKISIKCRNFPDSIDNIKKTLKLNDGNDYYLFCTTLIDNKPKVIITKKCSN